MADMNNYRTLARAAAQKAADLDRRGCETYNGGEMAKGKEMVRDAKDQYTVALNNLMLLMKFDKSPEFLASYQRDAQMYVARMEKINEMLQKADNAPVAEAGAAGGGAHGKAGGAEDEKSKFKDALSSTIMTEKPNVPWEKIGGLSEAIETLKQIVTAPRKFPSLFQGENKPYTTVLLYGPPGTGKTQLAKAVVSAAAASARQAPARAGRRPQLLPCACAVLRVARGATHTARATRTTHTTRPRALAAISRAAPRLPRAPNLSKPRLPFNRSAPTLCRAAGNRVRQRLLLDQDSGPRKQVAERVREARARAL